MNIQTARLLLVPATAELVGLEITDLASFGKALSAEIPSNWPPEQMADALPWFQKQLEADPSLSGWLTWYALFSRGDGELPLLVGSGGFFGPPEAGRVEIGYSVLPQFQGNGYATEIAQGLTGWAFSQPSVQRVAAEPLSENAASVRVLTKLGFVPTGKGRETGSLHFERTM